MSCGSVCFSCSISGAVVLHMLSIEKQVIFRDKSRRRKEGRDCYFNKRNMYLVIRDMHSVTVSKIMMATVELPSCRLQLCDYVL